VIVCSSVCCACIATELRASVALTRPTESYRVRSTGVISGLEQVLVLAVRIATVTSLDCFLQRGIT
jgi:hypothetical protein